ncbi:MAG: LpqB family beta-propeller domain-containing protein, partial [Chloroflexota bacterium]
MHRVTIILGICLFLLVAIVEAQARWQCGEQIIQDVQWSPDGTRLAVMTLQGVLFYDADMQLQQTVVAPQSIFDQTSLTGIVWSPDSQWVVLPDHVSPDDAERGVQGWSIANAETGELR